MRFRSAVAAAVLLLSGSCFAARVADVRPVAIPFTLHGGNIVVTASLDSGPPLPFVFDSGLSRGDIVTTQAAAELGLTPTSGVHFGDASGTSHVGGLTSVHAAHVGGAVLVDPPFAIVEVPPQVVERPGETPIAGFIGAPLMEHAVLCIDYRHHVMHRWPRDRFDRKGYESVPMPLNHGLPTIRADVDGLSAILALDSGNNGGVELFPSFARPHHLLQRYPDLKPMEGVSGSGEHFDILGGTARVVAVAPHTALRRVSLMLIAQSFDPDWGIDGLAGYKVLSRLNPCLDRDGQRLYLPAGGTHS